MGMITTTHRFRPIRYRTTRRVECPGCGVKRTVARTFEQTINPFNTNEDGTPKTAAQVSQAVRAEADAWEPTEMDRFHQRCWDARPAEPAPHTQ